MEESNDILGGVLSLRFESRRVRDPLVVAVSDGVPGAPASGLKENSLLFLLGVIFGVSWANGDIEVPLEPVLAEFGTASSLDPLLPELKKTQN
eukprot:gene19545-biopygen6148